MFHNIFNHFREEGIERAHKVPNPDGTFQEIPRGHPKLRTGAVPSILPGCPSYFSAPVPMHRLSLEVKEADQFTKVIGNTDQFTKVRNSVTTLKN